MEKKMSAQNLLIEDLKGERNGEKTGKKVSDN